MKIRKDERGLYITGRDGVDHYRPGAISGYAHAYAMQDGGLVEGDNPKTAHVSGAPLIRIRTADGKTLYWAATSLHDREEKLRKMTPISPREIHLILGGTIKIERIKS